MKIFSGPVNAETCVKKKGLCDSPSSPLHLFIYEKETDLNSTDNSAFDVFIWLTKCAQNAPKAVYNFKNVPGWTPGPRFNGRGSGEGLGKGKGRAEERASGTIIIETEGRRSPIFWCSGTSNFEPSTFGIHQNSKMPANSLRLKMNTIYHIGTIGGAYKGLGGLSPPNFDQKRIFIHIAREQKKS